MKVLVSGFEPFGKSIGGTNSSWEGVRNLPETIENAKIIKTMLPVKYDESFECLYNAISEHNPDIVICVGQAEGRLCITPEYIAMNLIRTSAPDNGGCVRDGKKVKDDKRVAYLTKLPIKNMVFAMLQNGIPACVSYDAGGYVCNALMYNLLSYVETTSPNILAGFIHVPKYIGQDENSTEKNSMKIEDITKGLALCIAETVKILCNKGE